jgi:hypothetical protein
MTEERRYSGGSISDGDLRDEISKLWRELQTDSSLRRQAEARNIDLAALAGLSSEEAIQVKTEGMGFDPATTALIVAFAPVAAKVVRDLWDNVLLPRIRRDKGADALLPAPQRKA